MAKKEVSKKQKAMRYFLWTILGVVAIIGMIAAQTIISDQQVQTDYINASNISYNGGQLGLNPSNGVLIGDSTTAAYVGQNNIAYYLLTTADTLMGTTITTDAVPGKQFSSSRRYGTQMQTRQIMIG